MYAYSTNEGNTWSAPIQIPSPGLANNIYGWIAAGDDGRVDIAWYGITVACGLTSARSAPAAGPTP